MKMREVKQSPTEAIPPPSSPAVPIILNTHSHHVDDDGDDDDDVGDDNVDVAPITRNTNFLDSMGDKNVNDATF